MAEISIISDKIQALLDPQHKTLQPFAMDTASSDILLAPIEIQLRSKTFTEHVHVAPIEDDMLTGLDFLKSYGA